MSEYTFEPFQKVLVRDNDGEIWIAAFFSHLHPGGDCKYVTNCGLYYHECIPYEGNEYLVGTSDSPKPKWQPKPWELVAVRDDNEESWYARIFIRKEGSQFFCKREKGIECVPWIICEPLRKHFSVPDE